jgi:hypothetical protein
VLRPLARPNLASYGTKPGHTHFDPGQQWQCTLPDLLNHAKWTMVQHGIPQLYSKTGARILACISLKMIKIQSFKQVNIPTSTSPMKSIVGESFALM